MRKPPKNICINMPQSTDMIELKARLKLIKLGKYKSLNAKLADYILKLTK